jgi:hypothetical protein
MGQRAYVYYRYARYNASGHPRKRVREEALDEPVLALFDRLRIKEKSARLVLEGEALLGKLRSGQATVSREASGKSRPLTLAIAF